MVALCKCRYLCEASDNLLCMSQSNSMGEFHMRIYFAHIHQYPERSWQCFCLCYIDAVPMPATANISLSPNHTIASGPRITVTALMPLSSLITSHKHPKITIFATTPYTWQVPAPKVYMVCTVVIPVYKNGSGISNNDKNQLNDLTLIFIHAFTISTVFHLICYIIQYCPI